MPKAYKCSINSSSFVMDDVYIVIPENVLKVNCAIENKIRKKYSIYGKLNFNYKEIDLEFLPMKELSVKDMLLILKS